MNSRAWTPFRFTVIPTFKSDDLEYFLTKRWGDHMRAADNRDLKTTASDRRDLKTTDEDNKHRFQGLATLQIHTDSYIQKL